MWGVKKQPTLHLVENAAADRNSGMALDVLVDVVRTLGDYALDLAELDRETFKGKCDAWVAHLLHGHPIAGDPAAAGGRRDWAGLRNFVAHHRAQEAALVGRSLGDLRQVVYAFIQTINQAFSEDDAADARLMVRLAELQQRLEHASTEDVKREAMTLVTAFASEMGARKERNRARMTELGTQVNRLGTQLVEARRMNATDALTQLFNRRALDDMLSQAQQTCSAFGRTAVLLMVDVDHFKAVNDHHGHPVGDVVLKALADAMVRCFPRRSDMVARFGGEEFAVLLMDTTLVEAAGISARLLDAVRTLQITAGSKVLNVTVSLGVSQVRCGGTVEEWVSRADEALYRAKRGGRDRAVLEPGSAI